MTNGWAHWLLAAASVRARSSGRRNDAYPQRPMTWEGRTLAGTSGVAWGSTATVSGAGPELPKLGKPPKPPQPASANAKNMAAAGADQILNLLMACLPPNP